MKRAPIEQGSTHVDAGGVPGSKTSTLVDSGETRASPTPTPVEVGEPSVAGTSTLVDAGETRSASIAILVSLRGFVRAPSPPAAASARVPLTAAPKGTYNAASRRRDLDLT
jgi:hypothetical protein